MPPQLRPETTISNRNRKYCGNYADGRSKLDVAESPRALKFLARPPDIKEGSILGEKSLSIADRGRKRLISPFRTVSACPNHPLKEGS
jgi:hypothetical protein